MAGFLVFTAPAAAQSSHLARLEASVPAAASDAVSMLVVGGWASAWLAPAAADRTTGVLAGVEHSGFAAMTSVFAAARARVGPVLQVRFAQTRVDDLFDDRLLEQFPGLGTLRAAATQVGIDAAMVLAGGAGFSLGGQYERDEFIGEHETLWVVRGSAAVPVVLGVRGALALERRIGGGRPGAGGFGRVRAGIARNVGQEPVSLTIGAGAVIGDLWAANARHRAVAASVRATLLEVVSLSGSLGAERDLFGDGGWLGVVAFGLGLAVGPLAADVRRGGYGAGEAAPTAVSVSYEPR